MGARAEGTGRPARTGPSGDPRHAGAGTPPVPLPSLSVVANPPYQSDTRGTSDRPIYDSFMELAWGVADVAVLVTPGRFLFDAGKTPGAWNRKVLADPHMSVALYEARSRDVFPGVDIKGGVAVTARNALVEGRAIGEFSAFPELTRMRDAVWGTGDGTGDGTHPPKPAGSMADIAFQQGRLDLPALYAEHPGLRSVIGSGGRERRLTTSILTRLPVFSEEPDGEHDVAVLGLMRGRRAWRHMPGRFLDGRGSNLGAWKVMVPASNGSGAIGEVGSTPLIGTPVVGGPGTTHTQSFISFGSFASEDEAMACLAYVRTRFARALLGLLKVTQHNHADTWRLVPTQDFTDGSDIDWGSDIDGIDGQLFARYGLDGDEGVMTFVRERIRDI